VPALADGRHRRDPPTPITQLSLRELAQPIGLRIGTAVDMNAFANDQTYRNTIAREFSSVTAENVLRTCDRRSKGGDLRIVYVGETKNERARMTCYGRDGSHLSTIISEHLRGGWRLYYRGWATRTKKGALDMQNRLLSRSRYDWNILLNDD
jgi:hypothetical protein